MSGSLVRHLDDDEGDEQDAADDVARDDIRAPKPASTAMDGRESRR